MSKYATSKIQKRGGENQRASSTHNDAKLYVNVIKLAIS